MQYSSKNMQQLESLELAAKLKKLKLLQLKAKYKAYKDLMTFIPYTTKAFNKPFHLKPIVDAIELIKAGRRLKLLISAPPQHGKSEVLIHGMAYLLFHNPTLRIVYASYNAREAASRISKTMTLLRQLPNINIDNSFDNKSEIKLLDKDGLPAGGIKAVGITKGVGLSADLYIIDDPYGGYTDALSNQYNKKLLEFYHGTVETRLKSNSSVLVMHTRWAEDDLIGYLHKNDKEYKRIVLPAILTRSKVGANYVALCEELKPLAQLREIQKRNPEFFAANYQQRPEGLNTKIFKHNIPTKKEEDYNGKIIQQIWSADFAYTTNTTSDYTVLLKLLVTNDLDVIVAEEIRLKGEMPQIMQIIKQKVGTSILIVEDNGPQKGINDMLISQTVANIHKKNISGSNKITRTLLLQQLYNTNKLFLKRDPSWNKNFNQEIQSFPNGANDDRIDALSLGINWMNKYHRWFVNQNDKLSYEIEKITK